MSASLILGLLKVAIETFKDERKGRYLKKWNELNRDYLDEISKPDNEQSDLTLDRIMFECGLLAKLVLAESSGK